MLDTRTNEWLSRLRGNGPHLASLALSALIAVEFARVAISLLGGPVKSAQPVSARSAELHQRQAANIQALMMAHPFGVRTADPSTQNPANADGVSQDIVQAYLFDQFGNPEPAGTPITFSIETGTATMTTTNLQQHDATTYQ